MIDSSSRPLSSLTALMEDLNSPAVLGEEREHRECSLRLILTLDGLRGLAIGLVLWHHAPHLFMSNPPTEWHGFWTLSAAGWMGVDLFFVVSGFLITSNLIHTSHRPGQLRSFWARRALRIFPLAYLYLFVLLVITRFKPIDCKPGQWVNGQWIASALYYSNFHIAVFGWSASTLSILWSLAIEEQFYTFWPFVVRSTSKKALLAVCIVLVLLAPLCRFLTYHTLGYPATFVLTFCRFDALAWGAVLVLAVSDESLRKPIFRVCNVLAIPGWVVMAYLIALPFGPQSPGILNEPLSVFGFSLVGLFFACTVALAINPPAPLKLVLTTPIFTIPGKLCYGLYLWHYLCGHVINKTMGRFALPWKLTAWLVLTALVATASWHFFEKPILRLKRFFPRFGPQEGSHPEIRRRQEIT